MSLKILLASLLFGIFYYPANALVINEVMYDLKTGSDDGREWIEIYNDGDKSVDVSKINLFEADANHKLILVSGDEKIPAHGHAIIASDANKFKIDQPNFVGKIFDSSFSLNNTGETIMLKDGEKILDEFSYSNSMGAAGDGNSLQKINNVWRGEAPTSGQENKITYVAPSTPSGLLEPSSVKTSTPKRESKPVAEKITTTLAENSENFEQKIVPDFTKKEVSQPKEEKTLIFNVIFAFFLAISAISVYFLRRKRLISQAPTDFEILE